MALAMASCAATVPVAVVSKGIPGGIMRGRSPSRRMLRRIAAGNSCAQRRMDCLHGSRKRASDQGRVGGYDPTIGIMHDGRDGSSKFVFDMMEPDRPKVDRAVLSFLKSEALHPADFTIREDGVVRLNPELAMRVVKATYQA
jgi:hypothetical protein